MSEGTIHGNFAHKNRNNQPYRQGFKLQSERIICAADIEQRRVYLKNQPVANISPQADLELLPEHFLAITLAEAECRQ